MLESLTLGRMECSQTPLDQFLQDNCIFKLIENHHAAHLSPDHTAFCKNIGEAHKFFFSRHKDGKCSCRAIQLGYPSDTNVHKQPEDVKAQPAKVTGQQKRLDFSNSSDDEDVTKEKPET